MDPDEKHIMREESRAEFAAPQFISHYCENCHTPIVGESAKFNQYLPHNEILTKIKRIYCKGCIPEVIAYRLHMRNVADMTKELVKAFEMQQYYAAADKITPYRRVNHI